MSSPHAAGRRLRLSLFEGLLPIEASRVPSEIIAGLTLAALAIPEVLGYTKIAGTPPITGLYTMLIPMVLFAVFGSSRHLVVSADSATAAILAAGLAGAEEEQPAQRRRDGARQEHGRGHEHDR